MPLSHWVDKDIELVVLNIFKQLKEMEYKNLSMVAHACIPRTKEAECGGSPMCSRPAWVTECTLSQIKQKQHEETKGKFENILSLNRTH